VTNGDVLSSENTISEIKSTDMQSPSSDIIQSIR